MYSEVTGIGFVERQQLDVIGIAARRPDHTAYDAQVDRAHHIGVLLGGAEHGATAQPDPSIGKLRIGVEAELIEHREHPTPDAVVGIGVLGKVGAPVFAGLDCRATGVIGDALELGDQRDGQALIRRTLRPTGMGRKIVPAGPSAARRRGLSSFDDTGRNERREVFANRIAVRSDQSGECFDGRRAVLSCQLFEDLTTWPGQGEPGSLRRSLINHGINRNKLPGK